MAVFRYAGSAPFAYALLGDVERLGNPAHAEVIDRLDPDGDIFAVALNHDPRIVAADQGAASPLSS